MDQDSTVSEKLNIEQIVSDILSTIEREREREIIARRYGLFDRKETLEQIGELLNITRERVRQLEKAVMSRLKNVAEKELPMLQRFEHAVIAEISSLGHLARISDIQLRMELNSTQRIIENTTGHATLLFRPPYAEDVEPDSTDEIRVLLEASEAGYLAIGNRIDGKDWWLSNPDRIVNRILDGARSGEGGFGGI